MKEHTLAILKPDCIQKNLIGKVIDHLLTAGFEIIALKMTRLSRKSAGEFYAVHKERPFFPNLLDFMTESEIVPMILMKKKMRLRNYAIPLVLPTRKKRRRER